MVKKLLVLLLSLPVAVLALLPMGALAATVGSSLTAPESGWSRYDDSNPAILYPNGKGYWADAPSYNGGVWLLDHTKSQYMKFVFTGTKLRLMAITNYDHSTSTKISIDGVSYGTFSEYTASMVRQNLVFEKTGLSSGRHEVIITPSGGTGGIDAIDIDSSGSLFKDVTAPYAPTGLVASPFSGKTNLTWNASTSSDGGQSFYNVFVDGVKHNSSPLSGTSYTVTGLTDNATHVYYVVAFDDWGNTSPKSDNVTTLFDSISPISPVGLTINGKTDAIGNVDSLVLKWTPVDDPGLAGYNVYQIPSAKINNGLISVNQYTVTGVAANTKLQFAVTAVDQSGNESAKSSTVSYTYDTLPPGTPTDLTATAGVGQIGLKWTASADAMAYKIYQDGSLITTVEGTSYEVSGLANQKEYSYEVSAVDVVGNESSKTSPVKATTLKITVPNGIKISASDKTAQLSWAAVPDTVKYIIYRDGEKIAEVTSGVTYTDSGLDNEKTYTYRISAVNSESQESEKSDSVSVKPSKTAVDFGGSTSIPFSVGGMLATAVGFLTANLQWVVLVLAVLFSPVLIGIVVGLMVRLGWMKPPKEQPARGKGKGRGTGKRSTGVLDAKGREAKAPKLTKETSGGKKTATATEAKPARKSKEGLIKTTRTASRNGKSYSTTVYVKPENYKQGNVIDMRQKKKGG